MTPREELTLRCYKPNPNCIFYMGGERFLYYDKKGFIQDIWVKNPWHAIYICLYAKGQKGQRFQ